MEKRLLSFVHTLDLTQKKILDELGESAGVNRLTINQFRYIDAIDALGEPTITAIAQRMGITKASVTAGINKLIRLGFVIKDHSITDKRVIHVRLTETGKRLVSARFQALKEYGELVTAALSEEETRQFEAVLAKIVKIFQGA
jgi:DNA-binding MarR family transcriptional regulator